jgi:hypothetical protein
MEKYLMAAWQVLSPDLSLLDFFFWDCMNCRVCHNGKLQSMQHAYLIEAAVDTRKGMEVILQEHELPCGSMPAGTGNLLWKFNLVVNVKKAHNNEG